jgi:heme-degrading monooxygenase HmoA
MATISTENDVTTVVVDVGTEPDDQASVLSMMQGLSPVFARQPGFVSLSLHRSDDGARIMQYIQWKSLEDHFACMASDDVAKSGAAFMSLLSSGKATMDVKVYEVIYSIEA